MKTIYIECICYEMEDLTRLVYNSEYKEFYFEYRIVRFPGECEHTVIKKWYDNIIHKYKCIRRYFKTIWWAIRGRPIWYTAQPVYNNKEALLLRIL